jgi:Xaa-Pro dipeptidase
MSTDPALAEAIEDMEEIPEGIIPIAVAEDDAAAILEGTNPQEPAPASMVFTSATESPALAEAADEVPEVPVTAAAELSLADQRRLDIDAKQELIARLLHDCDCEGLLVIHPANFRWLTAGATPVGLMGRDEAPALFFNAHQRWLVCSATDSSRYFADELDGLGFQLKEWHWSASREQLLADLVFGRKVATDQPFRQCKPTGPFFTSGRRRMSPYEVGRLIELGDITARALAATARNFEWGDTENEIAGHLAHRLLRHGVESVALQINGDGRGRVHKRRGSGAEKVEHVCVLQVTARKFGLHVTAARTVVRSKPDEAGRAEFEAALRTRVAHLAVTRVNGQVATTLNAGRAVLRPTPFEHEWRLAPPVSLTGREPSEGVFLAAAVEDRWAGGWATVWQERIGAAAVVDTYLLEPNGWKPLTPPIDWPVRRAISQGRTFDLADLLVRSS